MTRNTGSTGPDSASPALSLDAGVTAELAGSRPAPRPIRLQLPELQLAGRDWPAASQADPHTDSSGANALPVLALHGWLDNAASFAHLVPLLPGAHRIVALDLPGHGESDHRPPGAHTYFLDYVPTVFEAADALGWDRFILLGHSMGAGIGTLAAGVDGAHSAGGAGEDSAGSANAGRMAGLILIDGMGPLTDDGAGAPQRYANYLKTVRAEQAKAASEREAGQVEQGGGSVYATAEHAVRARKLVGGLSDPSARRLVLRSLRARLNAAGEIDAYIWGTDPRLKWPSPLRLTEEQVRAFLSAIAAPTLMIAAGDSEFAAYKNILAPRAARIASLTSVELSGGHHLHMERPAPVARAIVEFLKTL